MNDNDGEQLEQALQSIPVERHKQRMSALYVDAVAPDLWRRPTREISQITAHAYLQDAANDYSGQYDRYTGPGTYKPTIQNFIPHWKNGLAAQHSLSLNDLSCRPG